MHILSQDTKIQIMQYMDNFTFSLIFCHLPEYNIDEYKHYINLTCYLENFPTNDPIFNINWILYLIDNSRNDILHFYYIDCKSQFLRNELLSLIILFGDEKIINSFLQTELFDCFFYHEYEYRIDSYYYGLEIFALKMRNGLFMEDKYLYMDYFRIHLNKYIVQLLKEYKAVYPRLSVKYFPILQDKYKNIVRENNHVHWFYYFDKRNYLQCSIFPLEERKNEEEEEYL